MLKLIIVASILQLALAQTCNYCAISSQHTMCLHPTDAYGPVCAPAYSSGISTGDQLTIVNFHNQLRRRVAQGLETRGSPGPQPPAANMRQLTWDDTVATVAQRLAQQCVFQHDANRNICNSAGGTTAVGQNIYMEMSTAQWTLANWTRAINAWYNEVDYMNSNYVNSFPSNPTNVIGHYTQVTWANTGQVGCGFVSFRDTTTQPAYPYKQLYVCNYAPAGNYLSQPVYTIGPAASQCPAGTIASDSLCV